MQRFFHAAEPADVTGPAKNLRGHAESSMGNGHRVLGGTYNAQKHHTKNLFALCFALACSRSSASLRIFWLIIAA